MKYENKRGENVLQQFKNREISPLEYEIPVTDYNQRFYFDVLWPDIREKYQSELQENNSNIAFDHRVLDAFRRNANIEVKEKIIQLIEGRDGWVIDLGAGASDFIPLLNQALIKDGSNPKGLRLDLQYSKVSKMSEYPYCFITNPDDLENFTESEKQEYLMQRDKARAISGDALTLPLKNEVAQILCSNELLPYFLEKGEVYEKFIKFRQKSADLVEIEYQYRESFGPQLVSHNKKDLQAWENHYKELAAKYVEAVKDMEDYKKKLGPDFFNQPQYDLELLSMFFKEGSRILKSDLKPKAEMRIYPFTLYWLLKLVMDDKMTFKEWQDKTRDYNIARIENFLKIIREDFSQAKFYSYDPDISLAEQLDTEQDLFISLFQLLKKHLPQEILTQWSQVFNLNTPVSYQRGVLILTK